MTALLVLAACANRAPIILSAQFAPPDARLVLQNTPGGVACRVHLAEVRDLRSDTRSMGEIGGRPIRASDAAAWVRSGLRSLARDSRIRLADSATGSDLVLSADLLKGYVMSMNTTKASDVVLSVHYSAGGMTNDQIYRGNDESSDWAAGEGETQSALNRALAQALDQVQNDILARCSRKGG